MSPVRVVLEGLSDLRTALRELPETLTDEAAGIVQAAGLDAKAQIQTAYPEGATGNLRGGVTVRVNHARASTSAVVRSRARHAHLFEWGTRARRTRRGANRGAMPEAPQAQRMIPIAIRVRRQMIDRLIALVERAGLTVRR